MNNLITVTLNENQEPIVSGRDLHQALEIKTQYTKWLERMSDYGFEENEDYVLHVHHISIISFHINDITLFV